MELHIGHCTIARVRTSGRGHPPRGTSPLSPGRPFRKRASSPGPASSPETCRGQRQGAAACKDEPCAPGGAFPRSTPTFQNPHRKLKRNLHSCAHELSAPCLACSAGSGRATRPVQVLLLPLRSSRSAGEATASPFASQHVGSSHEGKTTTLAPPEMTMLAAQAAGARQGSVSYRQRRP